MKQFVILFFAVFAIAGCSTNSITGRSQLSLIPKATLQQEGEVQYRKFLSENKVVSSSANAQMVKRVGTRIASAIASYYKQQGQASPLAGYNWEFNLVEDKAVNAWCMPGGKVVVYTGLLPVTQNEAALAIVLGHEITHAVADHSDERMSQVMLAQGFGSAANVFTQNNARANSLFNNVYGPAASVGVLLPNSRKQELEADRFGMIFAAIAGYDPREALGLWTRMANASQGNKPPEFISTHPADDTRIAQIKKYLPEAMKYYKKK